MSDINRVRLHLTNATGLGVIQLLESLLPALENNKTTLIEKIYLPKDGRLSSYSGAKGCTTLKYRRYLPNSISRFLECTLLSYQYNGSTPILVLADLPLRCNSPQTVFVQTPHLVKNHLNKISISTVKYSIARMIFRFNQNRVDKFIVQTEYMKKDLIRSYPKLQNRVFVIPQPVPDWLMNSSSERPYSVLCSSVKLRFFYPAANYPHKNHSLLAEIDSNDSWPVEKLILTIDKKNNPSPHVPWIDCVGELDSKEMVATYKQIDALIFLSKAESYGFPLVEAMYLGIPVVCPDLPYAHTLCGNQALYFDPDNIDSLQSILQELARRLECQWRPQWSQHLSKIPDSWSEVASSMLSVVCSRSSA